MKTRLITLISGWVLGLSMVVSTVLAQTNTNGGAIPNNVPDYGSTMLLLGVGLAGVLLAFRRKLR